MFSKVIPNKEVELQVYALRYKTGALYTCSKDNSNVGVSQKATGTISKGVMLVPAYTYDEAEVSLHKMLLQSNDLYLKEIIITEKCNMSLNGMFDWAFKSFGEKDFEEDSKEMKTKEVELNYGDPNQYLTNLTEALASFNLKVTEKDDGAGELTIKITG